MAVAEHWKAIEGWPYEVSSCGRVRRTRASTGTRVGKILRHGLSKFGYPYVTLYDRERNRTFNIHTLVCEAFHGSKPTHDAMVAHNDGNPANNTVENLRWDSMRGNCADRRKHGTENIGARNGMSKLSAADVTEIRTAIAAGADRQSTAERFGIHKNSLDQIVRRATWRDLP